MHLLAAQPGTIEDGIAPVDPGQTPADVVLITAADTEIAALSEARAALGEAAPSLRLINLMHLRHPVSVDLHLDECAARSRLVVARVLGGEGYWPYGMEQYAARLHAAGVPFVALPGDDKPDEGLRRASTVSDADYAALWSYLVEGGPGNAANFLRHTRAMLEGSEAPPAAAPLLRAGLYWPGEAAPDLAMLERQWQPGAPVAALVFYRALVQGAGLHPVNRMIRALMREGLNPLPVFVASLKDAVSAATLATLFEAAPPAVVLNATSFAIGSGKGTPLDAPGRPVFQVVFSGGAEDAWESGTAGLSARDIAMNVALPEVDGRILSRAVSWKAEALRDEATQCAIATYRARGDRVAFAARLAANWARLGARAAGERRVALVLANYPNKDGRLANGVGLDTPASTVDALKSLAEAGYAIEAPPEDSAALMRAITVGPTNWLADRSAREGGERLSLDAYRTFYDALPWAVRQTIEARWGAPEDDPFCGPDGFALSILRYGHAVVGVQPARGYNVDPQETYHSPDLPPPHNYIAFYAWLREEFDADAIVHMGKHGNLEWLPGKAVALSKECLPEAILGPVPHIYPFIVNDPGEGTQAKRRAGAVIIDHLTPPLTRAESYGPLRDLEALVDEYYDAAGVDPRRLEHLRREILALTAGGLAEDAGVREGDDEEQTLARIDAWLCELKESQIRDGLHIFGTAPDGRLEADTLVALSRIPRGGRESLIRALAADFDMPEEDFDPLDCAMAARWTGPRPSALARVSDDPWRSNGDTVERLELFAAALVADAQGAPGPRSTAVLEEIDTTLRPALRSCGPAETAGLLAALDARFVAPGPSGAPTRGRPDVLPTGRNFYSVDTRAVPTPTAWTLGWHSASLLIERHLQDHGEWLSRVAMTAWGTANMRTGGDDIAQALALMGVRPTWDGASRRVTGFEIMPLPVLDRPRVDVTLRVSGFFRDAFPAQMDLIDSAARAVMALDEPEAQNPLAARYRADLSRTGDAGRAGARVFGSKPGAYGAGLQAMIDERLWARRGDLAETFLDWGGYAYGGGAEGRAARDDLAERLGAAQAVVHNQDNREHDLLDSDDYYQFEGGLSATIEHLSGAAPHVYHNDHSRPERPVIRTLDEEIARVVRARAVNPKWIAGVKRHGYKGAFEIAATVDYLFAFAATTGAVRSHHFDLCAAAYLEDEDTRAFIEQNNPAALREIAERLTEAVQRGLWQPRSNRVRALLEALTPARAG